MRKLIIIMLVFAYVIIDFAQEMDNSQRYEIKILEKLVIDVTRKNYPSVYFYGISKSKIKFLITYSRLMEAPNIEDADFVFIKNVKTRFNASKPTLALDFSSLYRCKYCIGVFSWRNGRPILILIKKNLKKFKIYLPPEYRYFIENRIYIAGENEFR